jgi:hypothetical protein
VLIVEVNPTGGESEVYKCCCLKVKDSDEVTTRAKYQYQSGLDFNLGLGHYGSSSNFDTDLSELSLSSCTVTYR